MSDPVLKVNHLNISFQGKEGLFPIVKDLSFELGRGRILGIAGQSGAGKSLTVHGLASLLPEPGAVTSGEILFGGCKDLLKMEKGQRQSYSAAHLSVILQDSINALNPYERVGRQMEETIGRHGGNGRKRALDILSQFGISEGESVVRKYPHQLSGGMRQRIAIALALESGAEIVVADEPTTSVDAVNQLKLVKFLKGLCHERGLSMIYVSHNLGLIGAICDDVLVMKDGRAVEQGTVHKVFHEPDNSYTKELIREAWLLSAQGRGWEGEALGEQAPADIPPPAGALLWAENLKKTYVSRTLGRRQVKYALKDVGFYLKEGETLGIVGESGCGKTTLARIMAGLEEADQGRILYKGRRLDERSGKEAADLHSRIQLVFQNPFACLDPRMTIGDSLNEALGRRKKLPRPQRERLIVEALAECGLRDISLDRRPDEFSGGQLQRISITRALLCEPGLLIADEITSALDVSVQRQILELLKRLKAQRGLSMIFISHDLSVIREISDRILVFRDGRIAEEGTARHIFSQPKEVYTKELLDSMIPFPDLEGVRGGGGERARQENESSSCHCNGRKL